MIEEMVRRRRAARLGRSRRSTANLLAGDGAAEALILEFEGTSTDASLWASMDNKLIPFGEKRSVDLLVLTPEGKTKTAGAPRWGPDGKAFYHECTWPEGVAPAEGAVAKMLETPWCRKLGYLRITGGMDEPTVAAFNKAFDSLKGMEACLLDCRWMGGGGDPQAWAMAGRFFKVGADNGEYGKLGPAGPWQFEGPLVMLQNENEVSSAETFTWAMTETVASRSDGRPAVGASSPTASSARRASSRSAWA
jgi:hypothetical protein